MQDESNTWQSPLDRGVMRDPDLVSIVRALVAYAGPLDDPRIGWTGHADDPSMFRCERCGRENLDCSKIEHKDGCSAFALLKVLSELRA